MSRGRAQAENGENKYFGSEWIEFDASSNRGGWLVTYADMMTIILTFMILLLSVSTIAQTKFDLLVEALTGRKVGNLHKVQKKIDQVVEKASLGGQVTTSIDEDGLKIQFSNALLFESGKAQLTDRAVEVFKPIGNHLVRDLDPEYGITIEGYTDDVPIDNARFQSNWQLSASRAIHVMKRLAEEGIDRRRMSVQGFADTRSATDVDLHEKQVVEKLSEEELEKVRAKNRRVVIRINRLDEDVLRDILEDRNGGDGSSGSAGPTGGENPDAERGAGSDSSAERTGGDGANGGAETSEDETSEDETSEDETSEDEHGIDVLNRNPNDANSSKGE